MRLAARASHTSEVQLGVFSTWSGVELDTLLVAALEKATHGAPLNVKPPQLQAVGEQLKAEYAALFASYSASDLTYRAAILHRFNQLLARHLSLVHTGMPRKHDDETLGAPDAKVWM